MKWKSGLFDGGDDGEYNGFGIVEISEIFAMQNGLDMCNDGVEQIRLFLDVGDYNSTMVGLPSTRITKTSPNYVYF